MICNECYNKMEYDEGEGNLADGYTCYFCIEEMKEKNKEKEE